MTPGEERYCFKESDKLYIFYDKDEFYKTLKRFLFLSQTKSLKSLASYLGLPFGDILSYIKIYPSLLIGFCGWYLTCMRR